MRDRVRERYEQDTTFHAVVDMLRSVLYQYQLTPSEVREAAMLACVMNAEREPMQCVVSLDPLRDRDMLEELARRAVR